MAKAYILCIISLFIGFRQLGQYRITRTQNYEYIHKQTDNAEPWTRL